MNGLTTFIINKKCSKMICEECHSNLHVYKDSPRIFCKACPGTNNHWTKLCLLKGQHKTIFSIKKPEECNICQFRKCTFCNTQGDHVTHHCQKKKAYFSKCWPKCDAYGHFLDDCEFRETVSGRDRTPCETPANFNARCRTKRNL